MSAAGRACLHLGLAVSAFLIALTLVVVPAAGGKSPTVCSWQGVWVTSRGTVMLIQRGSEVTGFFTPGQGKLVAHVSNLTLAGTWSESIPAKAAREAGRFAWTISRGGDSFTGNWRYGSSSGWSGSWHGTLVPLPAL